jgi:hypothetical protein
MQVIMLEDHKPPTQFPSQSTNSCHVSVTVYMISLHPQTWENLCHGMVTKGSNAWFIRQVLQLILLFLYTFTLPDKHIHLSVLASVADMHTTMT